jgi:hypothetical protein
MASTMSYKRLLKRPLSIEEILKWVSTHREAVGKWPSKEGGSIVGAKFETWQRVDNALRVGLRGLPGGSSLAQLLTEHFGIRNIHDLPDLSEEQILQWADGFHERTGSWPCTESGAIPGLQGEKWRSIDTALRLGMRSLPGGSSLAKLLAEHRGKRNRKGLPPLTEGQILKWADAFHERSGKWPTITSGEIADAPGETWMAVQMALSHGIRGLNGDSSLALLLAEKRGVRNVWNLPDLSIEQILEWADAFQKRTGSWPNLESGSIPESPGDTWNAVNHALTRGSRGLAGGSSLAELIALERGVRNRSSVPNLTRKQILTWADSYHCETGEWPIKNSGPIAGAPDETWAAIDAALVAGNRGLRPGSSLARLLAQHRGRRNRAALPPLTKKKILDWADKFYDRFGIWPTINSGPVMEAEGERWDLIDNALREGQRGLPPGSSLRQLLVKKRGVRNPLDLPPLTEKQILGWADLHFERTGTWPKYNSGSLEDAACPFGGGQVERGGEIDEAELDRGNRQ